MHPYITGYWAGSSYSSNGTRSDHLLFLNPSGEFRWSVRREEGMDYHTVGTWVHRPDEDVLDLHAEGPAYWHKSLPNENLDQGATRSWSIHYVSDCEEANTLLVLRELILASRNLPILFQRIHPPDDPVWKST